MWPGYSTTPRCPVCKTRLVKRLGNDEVKCLLRATVEMEKRLNDLERELHPPRRVVLRGTKPKKLMFRVRREDIEV
jgi:hypothetical protein